MCQVYQEKLQLNIVKDFQTNLINFVNGITNLAISTQNLAKIISHVDPNQSIVNKSVPALLDWGQNLFMLAERFEADFKSQLTSLNLEKEVIQAEAARVTMDNIYEKILFFLNHMCHSFVDYTRSESPMSAASNFGDNQSLASGSHPNSAALQRFKMMQQQQQYRRWSEAAATTEQHESNIIDANRRWSMPTNVSKTRLNVIPKTLAGLVYSQQQTTAHTPQTDPSNSDGINEAIQLLSFRPIVPSRPPSQQQQPQVSNSQVQQSNFQYAPPPSRNPQTSQTRQRQSRGELNEILILPRTSDPPLFLGFQQIAEARGENDEY